VVFILKEKNIWLPIGLCLQIKRKKREKKEKRKPTSSVKKKKNHLVATSSFHCDGNKKKKPWLGKKKIPLQKKKTWWALIGFNCKEEKNHPKKKNLMATRWFQLWIIIIKIITKKIN